MGKFIRCALLYAELFLTSPQATTQGPNVNWVLEARWVADGHIWTSSGISAGIDMTYAFVSAQYGEEIAQEIADRSEYRRNTDPNDDPFAKFADV
jgi:transcriptional regulator GlxA family with amidase domain